MAEPTSNQKLLKDLRLKKQNLDTPMNSDSCKNLTRFRRESNEVNWPENNLKTVVYRKLKQGLLVPDETSQGFVECETNRNSKNPKNFSAPSPDLSIDSRRARTILKDPFLRLVSKDENKFKSENFLKKKLENPGVKEQRQRELQSPPCVHLLQVSERAQKLNQMIESWSEEFNFDGRSRGIARDLLKGALDLEQSLIMLGRLQEASKFIDRFKRRKPFFEEQGRASLDRIRNKNHQKLEETRVSVDGSSRNCSEELKELIRASLHRQNFEILSDPNFSSVNSSRISNVSSIDAGKNLCLDTNESSFSTNREENKQKTPNLIAKLMGLDELPLETVSTADRNHKSKKSSNLGKPIFDIDIPKPKNLQIVDRDADSERRTLKEIIEMMQFKGLLKGPHTDEFKSESRASSSSGVEKHSRNFEREKEKSEIEIPPIVIIKPVDFACLEREEQRAEVIQEQGVLEHKFKRTDPKPVHKIMKTVSQNQNHGKEASTKRDKIEKMQKPLSNRSKLVEKVNLSSASVLRSQRETPSVKLKRTKNRSDLANNRDISQKIKTQNHDPIRSRKPISENFVDQAKKIQKPKAKPAKKPLAVDITSEKSKCKKDEKAMNTILDSEIQIKEIDETGQNSPSANIPETSPCETSSKFAEEADQLADNRTESAQMISTENNLKQFLLRSPSFLNSAEKLFDLNRKNPIQISQNTNDEELKIDDSNLVLDCANELLTRKSHRMARGFCSMLRTGISLDQLAEELVTVMDSLNYGEVGDDLPATDAIYVMLKRDLGDKRREMNCVWDLGWEYGFSKEEEDQIAEVEEHVLSKLIEEIVADL